MSFPSLGITFYLGAIFLFVFMLNPFSIYFKVNLGVVNFQSFCLEISLWFIFVWFFSEPALYYAEFFLHLILRLMSLLWC